MVSHLLDGLEEDMVSLTSLQVLYELLAILIALSQTLASRDSSPAREVSPLH